MLFLLLRDPRQAVANASPQADAASPAWSAAQRALADETAQLDGHARQIDELLHSAIRQLSDSFTASPNASIPSAACPIH